jgi:hypothetical protein
MGKIFSESEDVAVDCFSVRRLKREEQDKEYRTKEVKRYVFEEISQ